MKISNNTLLQRNEKVLSGGIDDEMVLLDLDDNNYIVINSVARSIWEMIEKPIKFEDLCTKLLNEYEVEGEVCRIETLEFLRVLEKKDMLVFNE